VEIDRLGLFCVSFVGSGRDLPSVQQHLHRSGRVQVCPSLSAAAFRQAPWLTAFYIIPCVLGNPERSFSNSCFHSTILACSPMTLCLPLHNPHSSPLSVEHASAPSSCLFQLHSPLSRHCMSFYPQQSTIKHSIFPFLSAFST
jgi:hypothetical protein